MKVSKYTLLFEINLKYYIYNTLSNALLQVDKDSFQIIKNAKEKKKAIDKDLIDLELYDILRKKLFISENDNDNFLIYKHNILSQRSISSSFHLTIAPTMDCCFRCYYCFESEKKKNYMSDSVMNMIVLYLNGLKNKPEYNLTWFGGEPLMAIDRIHKLYNKLTTEYKRPFDSNIITSGFHITKESIEIMHKVGITNIQITLDGLKSTHNKIKYIDGHTDVFTKVINNIGLLLNDGGFHVVIRVNITKNNADEYITLYNFLMNKFGNNPMLSISPSLVLDRSKNNLLKEKLFTVNEMYDFIINLWQEHKIYTSYLDYPSMFFNECAIRNHLSISFDPDGYAYKCWEHIGDKKYSIGYLSNEGKLIVSNPTMLNRQLYGADIFDSQKCSNCEYLPICHGGCPIHRIENVYEHKNNICCSIYQQKIKELLQIYIQRQDRSTIK